MCVLHLRGGFVAVVRISWNALLVRSFILADVLPAFGQIGCALRSWHRSWLDGEMVSFVINAL